MQFSTELICVLTPPDNCSELTFAARMLVGGWTLEPNSCLLVGGELQIQQLLRWFQSWPWMRKVRLQRIRASLHPQQRAPV